MPTRASAAGSSSWPATYEDGVVPLTQEDIAAMAGTSRATVNRVVRDEAKRGAVELARGRITILDADELARRCGYREPRQVVQERAEQPVEALRARDATRSPGACGPTISGPSEIISTPGSFAPRTAHSRPPCTTSSSGSAPNSRSKLARAVESSGESRSGSHGG